MSITINSNTANLCSEIPEESANPHTFTFTRSVVPEAPRLPPSSCSYGPFRVWRVLGVGGSAVAVGAHDITSNHLLCLKVFRKDRLKYKFMEEILMNELEVYKRLASSMPCPAIRFIMGLELSFQTKDHICLAMDLMASDLHTYMSHDGSDCYLHARRWTSQIALGINTLHALGIIHRDMKAGNILIDVRENVRIADFGLSYLDQDQGPLDRHRVYTSTGLGTIYCMAPEVLHNRFDLSPVGYGTPADWWSFGCVIYELVSRSHKALFTTKGDILTYVSWCSSSDSAFNLHPAFECVPPGVVTLLRGLLNPDPSSRYGFDEVVDHQSFLLPSGESEFHDAYSRALERTELPDSLLDLRYDPKTQGTEIWHRTPYWDKSRVPGVDWMKPALFHSL